MKKTIQRHELTAEEREESARLRAAWEAFKAANPGVSQEWLGKEAKIGSQTAVGQYLRGVLALNFSALIKLCGVLGASPAEISPRLVAIHGEPPKIDAPGAGAPRSHDLNRLLAELQDVESMGPQWAGLAQAITMLVRKLKEAQRAARHEHLTPEMRTIVESLCEIDKADGERRCQVIEDITHTLAPRKARPPRRPVKKAS